MKLYTWQNILRRIESLNYPIGAEIGVHRGELSEKLLENRQRLYLHMIDIWAPDAYKDKPEDAASEKAKICYEQEWESNMIAAYHIHNKYWTRSKMYRLPSVEAVKLFEDNYFDFVYIDAAHDYESVKADIREWLPKVKPGGYICGHDYGGDYAGVKKAVDEMFGGRVYEDSDFTWFVRI